jgi:hypothetical protein
VSEPVAYKDTVIIGEKCYSMKDGSIVWNLKRWFENVQSCSTVVVGDKAFIPLHRSVSELVCVDAGSGKEIWTYKTKDKKGVYWRGLLSGNGKIFANFGFVVAFDLDGKQLWKTDNCPGQMAFLTNHLIVTGELGTFCLSPKTGKQIWKSDVVGHGLALCGTKIFTGTTKPKTTEVDQIAVLSIIDGKELGRSSITKILPGAQTSLIIGAGKVYIGRPWQSETYCYGDKNPAP